MSRVKELSPAEHCGGLMFDKFDALLEICFEKADCFSLARAETPPYKNSRIIEAMLAPYHIRTIKAKTWFGCDGTQRFYRNGEVQDFILTELVYRADKGALRILKKCYRDIFLTQDYYLPPKKRVPEWKKMSPVEDLCFFRDGIMFLGTMSHSRHCVVCVDDVDFYMKLRGLATWDEYASEVMIEERYLDQ